jgi:hypothetical protein
MIKHLTGIYNIIETKINFKKLAHLLHYILKNDGNDG